MPRAASSTALNHYNVLLSRHQLTFRCPHCPASLLSKDFQNHCTHRHSLNSKLCCVWCGGRKYWNSGEKYLYSDHMIRCWRKFISRHSPAIPPPLSPPPSPSFRPEPIRYDSTHQCPKQDFFGREQVDLERLYEPIWPMPLDTSLAVFEDESLNLAASCVRLYVQGEYDFFHIIVRLVAFPSFLQAMDEDQGRTQTLPFSCLCNGGHWSRTEHRQHRHMIVVSPKDHFHKNVWKKIHVAGEDRPGPHVACKDKRSFRDPLHFINTLGYLSRRESRCEFTVYDGIEPPSVQDPFLNHFWIFTPLPKAFNLPLALQYDDGIQDYLHQKHDNFSMDQLLRFPLVFYQQKWKLKIKYLPGIPLGLVLPVSRDLRPWTPPTLSFSPDTISDSDSEDPVSQVPAYEHPAPIPPPMFLHLGDGDMMYFERTQEPTPDPDEWLALQVQGGNLFYHAVGEKLFTLRDHHQLLVNATKPTHELYAEQLTENAQLRTENHQLVARNTELVAEMTEKDTTLAHKIAQQDITLAQQEGKIAQQDITLAHLESEIAQLTIQTTQPEIADRLRQQKAIVVQLESENHQLVARNIELEAEVARLQQQEAPHKRRKTP